MNYPVYKLRDWINKDKLVYNEVCVNENAVDFFNE